MQVTYQPHEKVQVFSLNGKLDYESYAEFDSFIQQHYQKGRDVLLDLSELSYISSIGLRSFVSLAKIVRSDKSHIQVIAPEHSMVRRLIELSGFHKIMPFVNPGDVPE
ncbi:MAG: STAS domain-containing protein [Enterobacteriaceae bacterium]